MKLSEVQVNRKLIIIGDVLLYIDNSNSQNWTVTDLFQGGFEAKDDYETKDFFFNELELGWNISEISKKINTENSKIKYTLC